MPPKKATAGAAKARGLAKMAPTADLGQMPLAETFDPNVKWHAEMANAIETIKRCEIFGEDICSASALPMKSENKKALVGFQAPFDETILKEKAQAKSIYVCGINALWCDPLQSITPGVPVLPRAIEQMISTLFPNGTRPMEQRLEIQAPPNGKLKYGAAVRVSPEEAQHALILAIARAIKEEAEEQELPEWKRVLLSCPGAFVPLETADDLYFHVTNLRVRCQASARAMAHKTSQIIIDIYNYKTRKEVVLGPLTPKQVAEYYTSNFVMGNDTGPALTEDRTKPSTIEAAIQVYEKMFKVQPIQELVLTMEREMLETSPFNSIYKLLEIVKMCKSSAKIEWVMKTVRNRVQAECMDPAEFTVRSLGGRGGKQWVDVFLKQREMRIYLLGPFLDSRNIIPAAKEKLKQVFESPDTYVRLLRPVSEAEPIDCSWQASWPQSALFMVELIEQACFSMSGSEDHMVRLALKSGKIAE